LQELRSQPARIGGPVHESAALPPPPAGCG